MNTLKTINPYTETILNEYVFEEWPTLEHKIKKAQLAFQAWKKISVSDRIKAVQTALKYFENNQELIAKDITLHMGKPITQSRS